MRSRGQGKRGVIGDRWRPVTELDDSFLRYEPNSLERRRSVTTKTIEERTETLMISSSFFHSSSLQTSLCSDSEVRFYLLLGFICVGFGLPVYNTSFYPNLNTNINVFGLILV